MTKRFFSVLFVALLYCFATNMTVSAQYNLKKATDGGYEYEYVENDPLNTRIYTLKNGLKVYLTAYREEPRIQGYIAVKAGGKNDPANATGLAHYLEHMLFKGTSKFGTQNWAKEKPLLDQIEKMFEHYRTLKDPEERKKYYKQIDSVSNLASKFAVANEFDKMMSLIGGTGVNAYTSEDRTVYMGEFPSNELERWCMIEGERFSDIVLRLFHTELEAVYEEKNRGLDNDGWKVYEKMSEMLFKEHPYGTQTVIGTIEHLKNPSMTEIIKYFRKYYVPNNMAVCLSGDLDYTKTMQLVDKHLGKLSKKEDPKVNLPKEKMIFAPMHAEVFGPSSESVMLGYRTAGRTEKDFLKAKLMSLILSNSSVGLIDMNLLQQQKLLEAYAYIDERNDYCIFTLNARPREKQSLEEARDLLLGQIEMIKNGNFDEKVIASIITNLRVEQLKAQERNGSRAHAFVEAFAANMAWGDYAFEIDEMAKLTKKDIVDFASKNFSYNYACVFKKTGEDPSKQAVEKPQITKVEVNRDAESVFIKALKAVKVSPVQPQFLDYDKDILKSKLSNGTEFLYSENKENQLFQLSYIWEYGTNNDAKLDVLFQYLNYLGTEKNDAETFKNKIFSLGCNFYAYASEQNIYITVSGLSVNMPQAVALVDELLSMPKANDEALKNVIADIKKQREDIKKEKQMILFAGLNSYLYYGEKNPSNTGIKNADLDKITSPELLDLLKKAIGFQHIVAYYGPSKPEQAISDLEKNRKLNPTPAPAPERVYFVEKDNAEPVVYWYNFDMVQAELLFGARLGQYDKAMIPNIVMYNEYFGGGMNSIVFQEMREARALAYSVNASYRSASSLKTYNTYRGYIGTQADKLSDAMSGMTDIIANMPISEKAFETAKKNLLSRYETERITKQMKIYSFISARKMGNTTDSRKDVYEKCKAMSIKDVKAFQEKNIKKLKFSVAVIGSKDKLNFDVLKKYGKIVELNFDQLFGY